MLLDEPAASSAATETVQPEPAPAPEGETAEPSLEESTPSPESSEAGKPAKTAPASETGTQAKPPSEAEKRIKQLLAENKRLKAERQPPAVREEPKLDEPKKPNVADFADYEKYEAARDEYVEKIADFRAKKAIRDDRVAQARAREQDDLRRQNTTLKEAWEKRVAQTAKRNVDFDPADAVKAVQPNPALDHFLLRSEIGPDVLAHLAAHPEEAERLRELDPHDTYVEALRLESTLRDQIKGITPKPLPKPPSYVEGTGAPATRKTAADVLYG